jgi:formate hydrogenlyase subunit 4
VTVLAAINVGTYRFALGALGPEHGSLSPWGDYLLQAAGVVLITVSQAAINHLGIGITARLTDFSGFWILLVATLLTVCLLAFAPSFEPQRLLRIENFSGTPGGEIWPRTGQPWLLLALAALFIVAIAETGRIPVDNPDTHLELTMAHEGMLLEYSGRPLGLLQWGTHVKQLVILSLLAGLVFPWGMAHDTGAFSLALGLGSYLAKLAILGLALAVVETTNVKLRIFRVPELLGAASLLGLLAVTSIYLVGGIG